MIEKSKDMNNNLENMSRDELINGLHNREWLSHISKKLITKYRWLKWFQISSAIDNVHPVKAALIMLFLNLVINLPLACCFNAAVSGGNGVGLFTEPSDIVYEFLVHPIVIGYFFWLQYAFKNLFRQLAGSQIIQDDKHLNQVLIRFIGRLQQTFCPVLCLILSVIFTGWYVLGFGPFSIIDPPYASWVIADPVIIWFRTPVVFLAFYVTFMIIYNLIIYAMTMNEVFNTKNVNIQVVNPDRAGGLGFIGLFSVKLSILIAVLALAFSLRIVIILPNVFDVKNTVIILGFLLFLLATPSISIFPLLKAHSVMVSKRGEMLSNYSTRINFLLGRLTTHLYSSKERISVTLINSKIDKDEAVLDRLKTFNEGRLLIRSMVPVWPFNMDSLRKLTAVIFAAILPIIIAGIESLFSSP